MVNTASVARVDTIVQAKPVADGADDDLVELLASLLLTQAATLKLGADWSRMTSAHCRRPWAIVKLADQRTTVDICST